MSNLIVQPLREGGSSTRADRVRDALLLIEDALSSAHIARMTDRQIARKLGVSPYSVRRHRRAMQAVGTLGKRPGRETSGLKRASLTSLDRLDMAIAEGWYLLGYIEETGLEVSGVSSLRNILAACGRLLAEEEVPRSVIAEAVQHLEGVVDHVDNKIDEVTACRRAEWLTAKHRRRATGPVSSRLRMPVTD